MIRSNPLAATPGVRHAFFTRRGGVSSGIYASLNCGRGSNDTPEAVRTNRTRVLELIGIPTGSLNTVHQIHGTDVADATGAWPADPPAADGVVTATPGVVLGILTADCAPVLFADATAGVIGGAHCGVALHAERRGRARDRAHGEFGRAAGTDHGRRRPDHCSIFV